jgi:DNA-binding LacI/PurR family transcriptional regulator
VEDAAREAGYSLMFAGVTEASVEAIRRSVAKLCAYRVAGIVMHVPFELDLRAVREVSANVPLVAADTAIREFCSPARALKLPAFCYGASRFG